MNIPVKGKEGYIRRTIDIEIEIEIRDRMRLVPHQHEAGTT
jgi:hypothetical protein